MGKRNPQFSTGEDLACDQLVLARLDDERASIRSRADARIIRVECLAEAKGELRQPSVLLLSIRHCGLRARDARRLGVRVGRRQPVGICESNLIAPDARVEFERVAQVRLHGPEWAIIADRQVIAGYKLQYSLRIRMRQVKVAGSVAAVV